MPKVQLVGVTQFRAPQDVPFNEPLDAADAEKLIEFGGRACYQSWHKPDPNAQSNKDYLAKLINYKHFSVLEHSQASFYITDVPRSLTHEFERHRHFSYSELSQRYVNVESYDEIAPPDTVGMEDTTLWQMTEAYFDQGNDLYGRWVDSLESQGFTRKESRQAARFVLPESKETRILVTGNFRSWLEFLEKRDSPYADKAIQQVASRIQYILATEFPNVFQNSEVLPND